MGGVYCPGIVYSLSAGRRGVTPNPINPGEVVGSGKSAIEESFWATVVSSEGVGVMDRVGAGVAVGPVDDRIVIREGYV